MRGEKSLTQPLVERKPLTSSDIVEGEKNIVDSCVHGKQSRTHIKDVNPLQVEDENANQGNVNVNDDITDTFVVAEEFSDAEEIF